MFVVRELRSCAAGRHRIQRPYDRLRGQVAFMRQNDPWEGLN